MSAATHHKRSDTPCPRCSIAPWLCIFCNDEARHMIENKVLGGDIMLCDTHVEPFLLYLDLEQEVWPDGPDEVGAYCEVSECLCDTWK